MNRFLFLVPVYTDVPLYWVGFSRVKIYDLGIYYFIFLYFFIAKTNRPISPINLKLVFAAVDSIGHDI